MRARQFINHRKLHFVLLAFIGFLFFYKYGIRLFDYLPLFYLPYVALLYVFVFHLPDGIAKKGAMGIFIILSNIALIIASIMAFKYIPVEHLDVDRWSVITNYWDAYFEGANPYSSTSHMGNYYGSYPFYFILALPFYFIDEIGWIPVVALLVFQIFVHWRFADTQVTLSALVLAIGSICLPYEITTRSTLFANSLLVLLALQFLVDRWPQVTSNKLVLIAFIVGMLVCTRPIFGLAFLTAGIFLWRTSYSLAKIFTVGAFSLVGLILPFAHLYVLFPDSILEHNPISFMTTHFVPTWFYGIYLLAAVGFGLMAKEKDDIIPYTAVFLFFVVTCYALRYIILYGWHDALLQHHIDISYFFMVVPFLIYQIVKPISLNHRMSK